MKKTNNEIFCYDCTNLKKKREHYYSSEFIWGGPQGTKWSEKKWTMPHPLCQHKSCFEEIDGKMARMRGQFQLNEKHNCPYFKKKWWRR